MSEAQPSDLRFRADRRVSEGGLELTTHVMQGAAANGRERQQAAADQGVQVARCRSLPPVAAPCRSLPEPRRLQIVCTATHLLLLLLPDRVPWRAWSTSGRTDPTKIKAGDPLKDAVTGNELPTSV